MSKIFLGQVTGTAAGTHIFVRFGWRQAAAFSLGLFVWQFVVLAARGPHCKRYTWFGWEGGAEARKWKVEEKEKAEKERQRGEARAGSEDVRIEERDRGEKGSYATVDVDSGGAERVDSKVDNVV